MLSIFLVFAIITHRALDAGPLLKPVISPSLPRTSGAEGLLPHAAPRPARLACTALGFVS